MNRYGQIYTRKLEKIPFDIRISDLDSTNPLSKKLKNGEIEDQEVDSDYAYIFNYLDNAIESDEQNAYEYEYENEKEDEDEDEDADENDKDPQYLMFLENLTEHGKSYKLKISQNDEEPRYLYYEEPDNSDWCDELQTSIDTSEDDFSTKKEGSRRKKSNDHESMTQPHRAITMDPSYQMYLNRYIPSKQCAIKTEEDVMEYEKNVTTCDSDIMILDNVQNCNEVNNKQPVLAEKESSLREKLVHILEQPFDEKEYEKLSEYIEQKKPICRLLDLRGRAISSAFSAEGKSVLDDGPGSFRRILNSAQNDPPKALNLLRMFCFWLEHVPNEDVFVPWRDKQILKVRPSEKKSQIDTVLPNE